jgi:hypothetical protein
MILPPKLPPMRTPSFQGEESMTGATFEQVEAMFATSNFKVLRFDEIE